MQFHFGLYGIINRSTVAVGTIYPNYSRVLNPKVLPINYPNLHTQVSDIPLYPHDIPMAKNQHFGYRNPLKPRPPMEPPHAKTRRYFAVMLEIFCSKYLRSRVDREIHSKPRFLHHCHHSVRFMIIWLRQGNHGFCDQITNISLVSKWDFPVSQFWGWDVAKPPRCG